MQNEPIRCFEGSTKPHEAFWRFVDADTAGPLESGYQAEMELYGYISEYSWFDDDISPKLFKDDLWKAGKGGPILIKMNSGGGDVIAASVMRSILMDYPGMVTVRIDGLAASAATIVATAANRVKMLDSAYFMIHDPVAVFGLAVLNIDDLIRMAEQLKVVKNGIVEAYQNRTNLSWDRLSKMMSKETWMSAKEAQELGFVDEVVSPNQFPSAGSGNGWKNAAIVNALQNYQNVPAGLLSGHGTAVPLQDNIPNEGAPDNQTSDAESAQTVRLRAEVKILRK